MRGLYSILLKHTQSNEMQKMAAQSVNSKEESLEAVK